MSTDISSMVCAFARLSYCQFFHHHFVISTSLSSDFVSNSCTCAAALVGVPWCCRDAHEGTLVGVMVGSSASHMGKADKAITETICLHLPASVTLALSIFFLKKPIICAL
jgi:hypothetical protein